MTDEQFEYKRFEYIAWDGFTDHGEYLTPYEVVKLLNQLDKKNNELQKEVKKLQEALIHCAFDK